MIKGNQLHIFILFFCMMGIPAAYGQTKKVVRQTKQTSVAHKQAPIKAKQQISVTAGEYVDLGLPSGTLWATHNLGASKPEELGDYFAWGVTKGVKEKPKYEQSFPNYPWWDGKDEFSVKIKKYNSGGTLINHGAQDNKKELELEDDAAYVIFGKGWRMPSREQLDELFYKSKSFIRTKYKGVEGYLVKGRNGNTLFLPVEKGGYGGYWSRNLYPGNPVHAINLFLAINNIETYAYTIRSAHMQIRAVRMK